MKKNLTIMVMLVVMGILNVAVYSADPEMVPVKNITILYCTSWGYYARAASLAAELKDATGVDAELKLGEDGDLEVIIDGVKIFSKKDTGRFPAENEVATLLREKNKK